MGRAHVRSLPLAFLSLAAALAVAGCGGSSNDSLTSPSEVAPVGNAVIQGALVGDSVTSSSTSGPVARGRSSGIQVSVVGTPIVCPLDDEGQFTLSGLPAGRVTLHFTGPGVDATLAVDGLVDGQILVIEVRLAGASATLATPPGRVSSCNVRFAGTIESIHGSLLVVSSRKVEGGTGRKFSRGWERISLEDLKVGENVVVEGTLRGDGVVEAYEIAAEGPPEPAPGTWVSFKGRVDSVSMSSLDLHSNPNAGGLTLVVAGRKVKTDGGTAFKWSDGTALDKSQIKVGDQAYVEGVQKDGYVLAAKVVVDCR